MSYSVSSEEQDPLIVFEGSKKDCSVAFVSFLFSLAMKLLLYPKLGRSSEDLEAPFSRGRCRLHRSKSQHPIFRQVETILIGAAQSLTHSFQCRHKSVLRVVDLCIPLYILWSKVSKVLLIREALACCLYIRLATFLQSIRVYCKHT